MNQVRRLQLAAVAATALLVGFQAVVRQSVQRGQMQREAVSRQAVAWSDCGRLAGRSARDACRAGVPSLGTPQTTTGRAP